VRNGRALPVTQGTRPGDGLMLLINIGCGGRIRFKTEGDRSWTMIENATALERALDHVTALLSRPWFIGVITVIVIGIHRSRP
jgi:hypothetical protein